MILLIFEAKNRNFLLWAQESTLAFRIKYGILKGWKIQKVIKNHFCILRANRVPIWSHKFRTTKNKIYLNDKSLFSMLENLQDRSQGTKYFNHVSKMNRHSYHANVYKREKNISFLDQIMISAIAIDFKLWYLK